MAYARVRVREDYGTRKVVRAKLGAANPFVPREAAEDSIASIRVIAEQDKLLGRLVKAEDEPVTSAGQFWI
jgi:hypothetical protein